MNAEVELGPCPFCGGEPIPGNVLRDGYWIYRNDPDAFAYFIRCRSCAAQGGWSKSGEAGARRLWNMRVTAKEIL
jgi:hypothetical protein